MEVFVSLPFPTVAEFPLHLSWQVSADLHQKLISGSQLNLLSMPVGGLPYTVLQAPRSPDDILDARERTELSLLARIFWDESRDLRLVENAFITVWKCDQVRIFDIGKLLEPMGEVVRMGYYDAQKPEGCYVKGRVRMDFFNPFLGTAPVKGVDGSSFQVFSSNLKASRAFVICVGIWDM
ncbi:hypothetical protein LINPERHAP2_LOCUS40242 [Linum perenne]